MLRHADPIPADTPSRRTSPLPDPQYSDLHGTLRRPPTNLTLPNLTQPFRLCYASPCGPQGTHGSRSAVRQEKSHPLRDDISHVVRQLTSFPATLPTEKARKFSSRLHRQLGHSTRTIFSYHDDLLNPNRPMVTPELSTTNDKDLKTYALKDFTHEAYKRYRSVLFWNQGILDSLSSPESGRRARSKGIKADLTLGYPTHWSTDRREAAKLLAWVLSATQRFITDHNTSSP